MSRRYFSPIAVAVSAGLLLGACAASSEGSEAGSDGSEDETYEVVAAVLCDGLDNEKAIEATRLNYEDLTPEQFEEVTIRCASTPDALVFDVTEQIRRESAYLVRLDETFPIVDQDGYTFELAVRFGMVSLNQDPTEEPPGQTAALGEIDLSMIVTNTTPERELTFQEIGGVVSPLDQPRFSLLALYESGSPVCALLRGDSQESEPCAWVVGDSRLDSGYTLAPDAVVPLSTSGNLPGVDPKLSKFTGIPEAQWGEIGPALTKPIGYRIWYAGGDDFRFEDLCGETYTTTIVSTAGC